VHERNGLAASILGHLEEVLEVGVVGLLLTGQVELEGLAGEKTVEALAEVNVGLSVEEDPVVVSKQLGGNIDDSGLDISRGVEDLASHIASGSDNNKSGICQYGPIHVRRRNLLVKDRNTAQRTTAPFGMVAVESGVHGIEEGANEGKLHGRALDRTFPDDVCNCAKLWLARWRPSLAEWHIL